MQKQNQYLLRLPNELSINEDLKFTIGVGLGLDLKIFLILSNNVILIKNFLIKIMKWKTLKNKWNRNFNKWDNKKKKKFFLLLLDNFPIDDDIELTPKVL